MNEADVTAFGGWTVVARALSTPEHEITRQQVYAWWRKRDKNGFPNRVDLNGRLVFKMTEAVTWYSTYVPNRGGRPLGVKNKPKQRKSQPPAPTASTIAA